MRADGDLDSIFWQNFPCYYRSEFADPGLDILRGGADTTGAKSPDTPPQSALSQSEVSIQVM